MSERNYIAADGSTMTRLEWWQSRSAEQYQTIGAQATQIDAQAATLRALRAALEHITRLEAEWNANKMGGVNLQRKRWLSMGEIARMGLARAAAAGTTHGAGE